MAGGCEAVPEIQERFQNLKAKLNKLQEKTLTLTTKPSSKNSKKPVKTVPHEERHKKVAKPTSSGVGQPESHVMGQREMGGKKCFLKHKVTKIIIPPRSIKGQVGGTPTRDMVYMPQDEPHLTSAPMDKSGWELNNIRTNRSGYPEFNNQPSQEENHSERSDTEGLDKPIPQEMDKLKFPGYNYLGPGNTLDGSIPVNKVDALAKQHDEAYYKIMEDYKKSKISKEEAFTRIKQADAFFFASLLNVEPESVHESLGRFTGILGIMGKMVLEGLLKKQLYPKYKK